MAAEQRDLTDRLALDSLLPIAEAEVARLSALKRLASCLAETSTTAITTTNYLYGFLYANKPSAMDNSTTVYLNLTDLLPLAATPEVLVDKLDLWLNGAATNSANRARIVSALTSMPSNTSTTEKVRSAAYLLVSTPEGAIQP